MKNITIHTDSEFADKINKYIHTFSEANVVMETYMKYEIADTMQGMEKVKLKLNYFEEKYKITSEEFYERFNKGEFGDETDFMKWAGYCDFMVGFKNDLKILA